MGFVLLNVGFVLLNVGFVLLLEGNLNSLWSNLEVSFDGGVASHACSSARIGRSKL